MVRTFILKEEQRQAIEDYLKFRPNLMPPKVRALRIRAKGINFEQMNEDIELVKSLANLDVKIGRKKIGYADQHASFSVRHSGAAETKATFKVRKKENADR